MKTLSLAIGVLLTAVLTSASGASTGARRDVDATTRIAYSCSGDICLVGADGEIRRLTHDKFLNAFPAWSPDGKGIVFTSFPRNMTIDVMGVDGARRRHLTPTSGEAAFPAWSPDGETIAFDDDATGTVELITLSGSVRRPLGRRAASLPSWSPDGRELAYVASDGRKLAMTYGDIYAVTLATGRTRLLTTGGTFPTWSPDGKTIAFLRRHGPATWLWTINVDGSGQRRLCRAEIGAPSWSPSGRSIAFAFDGDIYAVGMGGGEPRRITFGHGDNLNPAWEPAP